MGAASANKAKYGSSAHAASAESYEFLCSAIDQAELVSRRVAHIGGVHAHAAALAPAGGVFDLGAAVRQGSGHCGIYLLGGGSRQPQRKTVVVGGRLPITRMGHHQPHAVVFPQIAGAAAQLQLLAGGDAKCAQHRVIKALAGFKIIGAEEEVGEHDLLYI